MESISWYGRKLKFTAKAPFVGNPSDVFRWECQFTPALSGGYEWFYQTFGGVEMDANEGEIEISGGVWRIVQGSGNYNDNGNNVAFYVDGALVYTFDDPNLAQEYSISVPYGQTKTVRALQTQGRFETQLSVTQMQGYGSDGQRPQISEAGDTLTVTLNNNESSPQNGVLIATPKLFSATGEELTSGSCVNLIVRLNDGSGGS